MAGFFYSNKKISDTQPICQLCGSLISYHVNRVGSKIVETCENINCIGHNPPNKWVRIHSLFGKEEAEKSENKWKETHKNYKEYWIKQGFSEEEARYFSSIEQRNRSLKCKQRVKFTKKDIIDKLGKEDANKFFKEKSILCKEYWIKRGFSEKEAIKNISEIQKKNSKIANCDIQKIRERSWRCKEYWIKQGFSEEEAIKNISSKQRLFSKDICVEKYGIERGVEIWEKRQKKWQRKLHENNNLHVGYSMVSQNLFDTLIKYCDEDLRDYIFYGSKNREYNIRHNDSNHIFDFTDLNQRKIIEFNGDIYHGNPKLFKATDYPNPFQPQKTSKEMWEYDAYKKNIAELNGFNVLTVWESDFRENENNVINECLEFLSWKK